MDRERAKLLKELIERRRAPQSVLADLEGFGWDSDEAVPLSASDLVAALEDYTAGAVAGTELVEWANAIESRDDIEPSGLIVAQVIFDLANPDLEGLLTPVKAKFLLEELRAS
jgi:hypothetical protein